MGRVRSYDDSITVQAGDYVVAASVEGDWNIVRAVGIDNYDVRCDTNFTSPNDCDLTHRDGEYYGHYDPVVIMQDVLVVCKTLAEAQQIGDTLEEARLIFVEETKAPRDKLQSKLLLLKC